MAEINCYVKTGDEGHVYNRRVSVYNRMLMTVCATRLLLCSDLMAGAHDLYTSLGSVYRL